MIFFDPLYFVFIIPALILSAFAQWRVKSTYSKYADVPNQRRLTGAQAARQLLDNAGLQHIPIQPSAGELTDNYDPRSKVLNLSEGVLNSASVAALGIAAHECGHAVQDAQGYALLKARGALVPAVNIGSNLGPLLIFASIILSGWFRWTGWSWVIWVGIGLFALSTVFALLTLPVELNASGRARQMLTNTGLVDRTEASQVGAVLNAAALTYVAGLLTALLQLVYYITLAGRRR